VRYIELAPTLRKRVATWFPGGVFEPVVICEEIASVARLLGAKEVMEVREGRWWGVAADSDWLEGVTPHWSAVFKQIVSVPGQVNSMRPETWLSAFADDIVVCGTTGCSVVTGDAAGCPEDLLSDPKWRRGILFTVASDHLPTSAY
jgi:hypothetical protein